MIRTLSVLFSSLVVVLALSMTSCDQMFSSNIFAKWTHPTPSASDIAQKTPGQLLDYVSSPVNVGILTDNPDLKAAALDSMSAIYGTVALSADAQSAAIASAAISIQTVASANQLSASILGALAGGKTISEGSTPAETVANITSLVKTVLPSDIAASLANGDATPPASFVAMIDAYAQANKAYVALGTGIAGGGYAAGAALGSTSAAVTAAESGIAVNAVISGIIMAVKPTDTSVSPASALWSALTGVDAGAFSVEPSAISDLTTGTGPIANLVGASSLSNLIGGSK